MSMTKQAAAAINRLGHGTADDVSVLLPGYSREQVRRALKAANDLGLIDSDGRQRQERRPHRATGKPRGSLATVYRKKATRQQYAASVWQFAEQCRL